MKKIIKKLHRKLDNAGSSLVLVIVALAFVGILVGALLTAAGYVYRLKLYDYNARDNFYYVEQAMDEIYAGVGSQTVEYMKEAYSYTVENMVRYSLEDRAYITLGNTEANNEFKNKFMSLMATSSYYINEASLADQLETYISNSTVELDKDKLDIVKLDANGNEITDNSVPDKIVIKNITLTRTAKYARSTANGTFTQTISTDIVVSRPDFNVDFNAIDVSYDHVFTFAMIADSGVEIHQGQSVPLTISGNLYAAADYYNKSYNTSTVPTTVDIGNETYNNNRVIATYRSGETDLTYYNKNAMANTSGTGEASAADYAYDGVNELSKYSGLYINGSDVSIMAEIVIVPGTISVFNTGHLSLYGKENTNLTSADVWTDNVVLGGYTRINSSTSTAGNVSLLSSVAYLRANMYVRDDMEINADAASLKLMGTYYGYGDSTTKDNREFLPTVDLTDFQVGTGEDATNRGHYNSSAIIVNGENASLDISELSTIFLAGRTYIELSETITENSMSLPATEEGGKAENVTVETYSYNSDIRDFKTGESISVKTNQLAYIPVTYRGVPQLVEGGDYYLADPDPALDAFYQQFFPTAKFGSGDAYRIPCVGVSVSGKMYYYVDFETAARLIGDDTNADELAERFIAGYVEELKDPVSPYRDYLRDISDYEDFSAGKITLPTENPNSHIYSSGAITAKTDTNFEITSRKDTNIASTLLSDGSSSVVTSANVMGMTNEYEQHYKYVKWALQDLAPNDTEAAVINGMDEAYITPLNRYFNFDLISDGYYINEDNEITTTIQTNIRPKMNDTDSGENVLDLESGSVWISGGSMVTIEDYDNDGVVRGIVITKGDVTFASDVQRFEGLIVCGGKVYITGNVRMISANVELCKAILRECLVSGDANAARVLNIFKGYNVEVDEGQGEGSSEESSEDNAGGAADSAIVPLSIDNIDYSDVIRYDNWMKNVE